MLFTVEKEASVCYNESRKPRSFVSSGKVYKPITEEDSNMTKEICKLQSYLKEKGIDAYLIFTGDDHGSEYVEDYYKTRAYFSGFTGSAGTLMVTQSKAYLWTDGRYFIQAAEQLKGTGIQLMKSGVEGVPELSEVIRGLKEYPSVACDFRIATVRFVEFLKKEVEKVCLIDDGNIIDRIWQDRPQMLCSKAFLLSDADAGESIASKLVQLVNDTEAEGCEVALLSSLDDIAWLYNLRGSDIRYNPVNYAFSLVSRDASVLYIHAEKLDEATLRVLKKNRVTVKPYAAIYDDMTSISAKVLLDASKTNYALYSSIQNKKDTPIFPTTRAKAIKNETEIRNIRAAHEEDAVAMIRFMKYLKENVGKEEMSELSLCEKLADFRREGEHFLDLSFETICGFGPNGAIVHYDPTPETNARVSPNQLLLVDSGGQYRYGTTDITRTFALGQITAQMKHDFTLVLKSHIALASAVFPKGTYGAMLDMLARAPIYREHRDFRHGTGHGVGYLLNVHEGPQNISIHGKNFKYTVPMEPGMVTSDEPGLYMEGAYGIRHENMVLCVEQGQSEFGTFCGFETLTWVPFDRDGIDAAMLTEEEKQWLNDYHKTVRERISPLLDEETSAYLAKVTEAIQ